MRVHRYWTLLTYRYAFQFVRGSVRLAYRKNGVTTSNAEDCFRRATP